MKCVLSYSLMCLITYDSDPDELTITPQEHHQAEITQAERRKLEGALQDALIMGILELLTAFC